MSAVPKIDVSPEQWAIVRDILREHVPDHEVWAFGSRATWTAKRHSDLDLATTPDGLAKEGGWSASSVDFTPGRLPPLRLPPPPHRS